MAQARVTLQENLQALTLNEWLKVIKQANLGKESTKIAQLRYIDGLSLADIGAIVNLERSTVGKRLPRIMLKIEKTAQQLIKSGTL